MNRVNIKVPVIVFAGILLASVILFPINGNAESKLYTSTDELLCGHVKVKVTTTCTEDSKQHWSEGLCADQHFSFIDQKTGKTNTVKGLNYDNDDLSNTGARNGKTNKWLSGLAYSWACVKGHKESYVIILYSSGGHCDGCEWSAIYDMGGKMLVSNQGKPIEKGIKRFRTVYKKLGLPEKWPRKSFLYIKKEIENEDGHAVEERHPEKILDSRLRGNDNIKKITMTKIRKLLG
jgi:hypothetical protein